MVLFYLNRAVVGLQKDYAKHNRLPVSPPPFLILCISMVLFLIMGENIIIIVLLTEVHSLH